MIDKAHRQIIQTAARAAGVPVERIAAAMAVMEGQASRVPQELPLLLSQADVASVLNVSRWTVRKLAMSGKLTGRPILGAVRFHRDEVLALATGGQEGGLR